MRHWKSGTNRKEWPTMSNRINSIAKLCDGSSIEVPTVGRFLPYEEDYTGIAQAVLFSYLGKTGNLMTSTQIYFKSFGKSLRELMDGGQRGFCEFITRNNDLISRIQARGPVWLSREFCADFGPSETMDQHAEEKIACCGDFWVSVVQYEDGTPVAEAITACSNSLYYALNPSDSAIYLPESGTLIYPKHWGMGEKRIVPIN
jgi:hypothetical protein